MTNEFILIQISRGIAVSRGLLTVDEICRKSQGCFGKDLLFNKEKKYIGNVLDRWYHPQSNGVYTHKERTNEEMINISSELEGFTPSIHNGGILGVKPDDKVIFGIFEIEVPNNVIVWEGRGYIGGHTSQSHWDNLQEDRKLFTLIEDGYYVKDKTIRGNTSGYYPKIAYWKE